MTQILFTERRGGVSAAPFGTLNLGDHVGDDPVAVAHNRRLLARQLGARPVFLRQVHGTGVVELTEDTPDGTEADACWTDSTEVACTVMVADCLPILLTTPGGDSVAAVHAGWRGLLGVLEALVEAWPSARTPAQRQVLHAWLGPCIGPDAFEVGEEVRAAYLADRPANSRWFTPLTASPGKYLAHLPALARERLQRLGIVHISGNDGTPEWCTVADPSRFFSHRRDARIHGSTGRMAACIWRG